MNTNWLKARQTQFTGYVTLYVVIILAVLAAANWLANRHNKTLDTTQSKKYSLSPQTDKVVQGLKEDAKIYYFDKSDGFRQGKDLLDRYDTLSTKLSVQYVDPYKSPQLARSFGVRTLGTTFIEVGARREEAKSLTEEEVTGAIIRTLKGGQRTLCLVTGAGEHGLDDQNSGGYSGLKAAVERDTYKTQSISLLEKPEVPKDCTVLAIGGPRFDYPAPVVAAIKTYIEGGGRALFLLDPPLKIGKEQISENQGLVSLLEGWGVTLEKNLVLDTSGVGQMIGLSEAAPLVTGYEQHPITRDMRGVATAMMLPRSLTVKAGSGATAEKLYSTTANSVATTNLSSGTVKANESTKGPFALAAAGTLTGEKKGRFVVVGSSAWAANSMLSFNGNRDLLLNMMNWLSSDEDLISIRPKDQDDRRLTLSRQQMTGIFFTSVILLPLAVIFTGVGVWWKRR